MGDKEEKYAVAERQIRSIVSGETDVTANMSNVAAVLHMTFGFWWTGFYRVSGDELVLGPFQGPVACTRIGFGRGVCGTAWKEAKTVIVPDVEKFPGHIACSSESRSEIVVPVMASGRACCKTVRFCGELTSFTIPHPAPKAPLAAKRQAPAIPSCPANRATFPKVPLLPSGQRLGRSSAMGFSKVKQQGSCPRNPSSVIPQGKQRVFPAKRAPG